MEYGIRKTCIDFLDDVSGLYADPVFVQSSEGTEINISDRSPNFNVIPDFKEEILVIKIGMRKWHYSYL